MFDILAMQHVWPLVDIMHAAYTHDNIGLKPSYRD